MRLDVKSAEILRALGSKRHLSVEVGGGDVYNLVLPTEATRLYTVFIDEKQIGWIRLDNDRYVGALQGEDATVSYLDAQEGLEYLVREYLRINTTAAGLLDHACYKMPDVRWTSTAESTAEWKGVRGQTQGKNIWICLTGNWTVHSDGYVFAQGSADDGIEAVLEVKKMLDDDMRKNQKKKEKRGEDLTFDRFRLHPDFPVQVRELSSFSSAKRNTLFQTRAGLIVDKGYQIYAFDGKEYYGTGRFVNDWTASAIVESDAVQALRQQLDFLREQLWVSQNTVVELRNAINNTGVESSVQADSAYREATAAKGSKMTTTNEEIQIAPIEDNQVLSAFKKIGGRAGNRALERSVTRGSDKLINGLYAAACEGLKKAGYDVAVLENPVVQQGIKAAIAFSVIFAHELKPDAKVPQWDNIAALCQYSLDATIDDVSDLGLDFVAPIMAQVTSLMTEQTMVQAVAAMETLKSVEPVDESALHAARVRAERQEAVASEQVAAEESVK